MTLLLLAVFLSTATNPAGKKYSGPDARANPPNIILILTDDQEAGSLAFMPNLQELLVNQGATFENFIFNVPLCCPSRASILRGQYAHNHQIFTNQSPDGGFRRFRDLGHEESTLATWLQDAGYRTALIGKYLNQYPSTNTVYIPKGWDQWFAEVKGHYTNYQLNENGEIVEYGNDPDDYETDVLARKAVEFIESSAGESPFFIFLSPFAPHRPLIPAERHSNEFSDMQAPRPPSFNEADVNDKPQWIREMDLLSQVKIDSIDEDYRGRLRMLLAVDDMLKALIDKLATCGELDSTYLFFLSDNGYHLGEHRFDLGKNSAYEESIRVPLIVRGPGVPTGQKLDHLVVNIDLAPTIAHLAGAAAPSFVDGISLVPLLSSPRPSIDTWRKAVLIQHWQFEGTGGGHIPDYRGVRTNDHAYIEYPTTGERELYDLRNDPYQLTSLHETADPALIDALATHLENLSDCSGEDCFGDGSVPVELANLSVAIVGNSVRLEWRTATETDNLGFDIERSRNGVHFEKVGFVPGNGTTVVPQDYVFVDEGLLPAIYYYRLRQVDLDGKFEYSEVLTVEVTAPRAFSLDQNYPNPFNPTTVIRFSLPKPEHVILRIFDLNGRHVRTLADGAFEAGNHSIPFEATGMGSGIYFYQVQTPSFSQTRRAMLLK